MRGIYLRRTFPTRYTVTFDCCGGSADMGAVLTNLSYTLDYLPTPTRSNYTFLGWFTAAEGGTQVTDTTVFTGDATVYAQWESVGYTITVTGTGDSVNCYVTINSKDVYKAGTYTVTPGTRIKCYIRGYGTRASTVKLNGTTVLSKTGGYSSYNYWPSKNATINLKYYESGDSGVATITITEE